MSHQAAGPPAAGPPAAGPQTAAGAHARGQSADDRGPLRRADHRTFAYQDGSEYAEVVGDFVGEGLDLGEKVVTWTPPQQREWIRKALGTAGTDYVDSADGVTAGASSPVELADASELFRPQGRMIVTVLGRLAESAPLRVVAERPIDRSTRREMDDYLRIEAAANAFLSNVSLLCPYDVSTTGADILSASARAHPLLVTNGDLVESAGFEDPRRFIAAASAVVLPPPGVPAIACEVAADLAVARSFLRAEAAAAGISGDRSTEIVVAVHEVLTNALVHGEPPRRLFVYVEEGALVCHVTDTGSGMADPLDAYRPLQSGSSRGRGLAYARQHADWLETATDVTGTHVRLAFTCNGQDG